MARRTRDLVRVETFERAREFLRRVEPVLIADEARTSLMYGIVRRLDEGGRYGEEPPILACVSAGERVLALAIRTPPYHLIVHLADRTADVNPALIEFLQRRDPELPGIHAENDISRRFAEAWTAQTGRSPHVSMEQRLYRLDEVVDIRLAPGQFRLAAPPDRDLLATWISAFVREATPNDPHPDALAVVDRYIQAGTLGLWDDHGPTTIAASTRSTPHGAAISLVYTPPEKRRRGYASSCVAALSRSQLEQGKSFCTLFTDLANPTSNAIYQRIGYRPLADITMIEFAG